mmetsp:Transcript_13341/g.25721  ORF Transcript_13341/g.25721 Transcript_13341/m.25721 type:complete len:171 (+) Transcript_13341:427-939(+)|eukprot:CAMPEP_0171525376 /NCGR_PEP_ID=MMETSP0959-20130129/9677_1 /TAXON_ID=87120 /ORGANISM="Aurantiochytrium limacinum, Strain ATCCMYA-1381" /LENGTH=170 /DNA_ID=CAMNT_0012066429 /DNA_START=468 /DNA_END=980 /DNA_ORIENTATION=-
MNNKEATTATSSVITKKNLSEKNIQETGRDQDLNNADRMLPQEIREQLEQLQRATQHYRHKMSQVSDDLNREQNNYEKLRQLYEAQMARFQSLQQAQILWQDDIDRKKEEVRSLREELDRVTLQWRKARLAEMRNEELEETNRYLERLVITVAVSVPIALLAEKQFRSKM